MRKCLSPAVINDVIASDVAAERIRFNDLLRSLCPLLCMDMEEMDDCGGVKMQRVKKIYGFSPITVVVTVLPTFNKVNNNST